MNEHPVNGFIFTFGSDHHPVRNAYVQVSGNLSEDQARFLMAALYGVKWAFCYPLNNPETLAMIDRYGMSCVRSITVSEESFA